MGQLLQLLSEGLQSHLQSIQSAPAGANSACKGEAGVKHSIGPSEISSGTRSEGAASHPRPSSGMEAREEAQPLPPLELPPGLIDDLVSDQPLPSATDGVEARNLTPWVRVKLSVGPTP